MIARYVVEDMLPIATVESVAFRELVSKIPVKAVKAGPQCRKTFSNNTKTGRLALRVHFTCLRTGGESLPHGGPCTLYTSYGCVNSLI